MPLENSHQHSIGLQKKSQSGWDQRQIMISRMDNKSASEFMKCGRKNSRISSQQCENSSYIRPCNLESNDEATKLLVSNVHFKVTDSDFLELFGEFRSLKFSRINYDSSGRPLGSAELIFGKRADAIKAIELYNGAKLDGQKLNIEVATPELLARSQFKNAVTFIPSFAKSKNYKKQLKYQGGPSKKSYSQEKKPRRTTVEELDAQLDEIVKDRHNKLCSKIK